MNNNLLKNTKQELVDEILRLREIEKKLKKESDKKDKKIKDLEWKLHLNSSNSSKPPSTNPLWKKTQVHNSRVRGKNSRWGQKGHKWDTLKQSLNPDIITNIEIHNCEHCSADLSNILATNETKRQIIDIPKPTYIVTEYRAWEKICPCCNHLNKAQFPQWVEDFVGYWPNIKASSVYIYNQLMSSYDRTQRCLEETYWLKISQTALMNFNKKSYENLEDFENYLKRALISAPTLHADETGVRINAKTSRIHTASTSSLTYYFPHWKRGKEAMDAMGILLYFMWNLISDHWKSYEFYVLLCHYFCNAHHLRELKWVIENEEKKWAQLIIQLLVESKLLVDEAKERWESSLSKGILENIHSEYREILLNWKIEYPEKVREKGQRGRLKKDKGLNLLERLELYEEGTLGFLHDFCIPFDNNLAERDLRMIKTRTKISWCFRSFEWAQWFCRIRSYISTTRKQNGSIYASLHSIFSWELFMPNF